MKYKQLPSPHHSIPKRFPTVFLLATFCVLGLGAACEGPRGVTGNPSEPDSPETPEPEPEPPWGNDDLEDSIESGSCDEARIEMPIVTHYDTATRSHSYMASDVPSLYNPQGAQGPLGSCNFLFQDDFLPSVDNYLADTYAELSPDEEQVRKLSDTVCNETGVPIDILQPDAFEGRNSGLGRLRSESGSTQILTAKVIDGSLATIILPPNWSADAAPGTYPIAVSGYYDIHANLFFQGGERWTKMVALSGTQDRTGVIGVLWNGGGAVASRTINPTSFRQFNSVVQWISNNLSGSKHEVFISGGSRGGISAMAMASNPHNYDYTIKFAGASAAPGLFGTTAKLMSSTYPSLVEGAAWSVGLTDLAQPGWTYPECGQPEYVGLTAAEAHLKVLLGISDPELADLEYSPASANFMEGLARAGTEVFYTATSSDVIVPYSTQVALGLRMLAAGVPVHIEVLVRGGHNERHADGLLGLQPVRFTKMIEAFLPVISTADPKPIETQVEYYRMNRESGNLDKFAPEQFPFAVEFPYRTGIGDRFPMVFTGSPGTEFRAGFDDSNGDEIAMVTATIDDDFQYTHWVEVPVGFPTGTYTTTLSILKVDSTEWQEIPSNSTPSGALGTITVEDALPQLDARGLATWLRAPGSTATNWSISEY